MGSTKIRPPAMPDEPDIDFEKLKAGDCGEWERAWPTLHQAGLNVACIYWERMGNLEEADFVIQAVTKAHQHIADITSFDHMCAFVAMATNNAIRDELDRREAVMHGGGKVESLDAMQVGIYEEGNRPGPGDDEATRDLADLKRITPDEVTHIIIMAELLDHALRRIDRRYSDVVRDSYFARLTHQEIADKRGLAIGSIGKYLERGLDALLEFVPERDKVLWWPQPNQSPL